MLNRSYRSLLLLSLLLALGVVFVLAYPSSEPFFYNDETRHVMTGVYFRDMLHDLPFGHLRDYTINYYLQYPALGLLVWPPFFHFIEGVLMSVFGTSIVVPKAMVGLFTVLACVYLFRLVRLSHDPTRATFAVLFFALSPLVFTLSHYVMLEVPALALGLAATYHFVAFLGGDRRRDLVLATLFSSLAALTRFDASYLVLLFVVMALSQRRLNILWRKDVIVAAVLALLVVGPFYALSASQVGWLHFKSATETLAPDDPGLISIHRLLSYPALLHVQLGIVVLIPAVIGLISAVRKEQRKLSWPYLAIVITTYITFTLISEIDYRHTIYWVPAFAVFAADGVALAASWFRVPQLYLPIAACGVIGMMGLALAKPLQGVRGYKAAAEVVAAGTTNSPYCLFVGRLNGNFIYQLRRLDPQRRLWVLRADKLLFSVLVVPGIQLKPLASSDDEILAVIFKYDPEFIVMEEQAASTAEDEPQEERLRTEFEKRLRTVITSHPERFALEKSIAVNSNNSQFQGMTLKVFKNTYRNENSEHRLELDILMLRRSLQTDVPY